MSVSPPLQGFAAETKQILVRGSGAGQQKRPVAPAQIPAANDRKPGRFGQRALDLELELGAIVGTPSQGMVSVAEADEMIFGYVLLNDWSARDIQPWEYQPLGPFLAKNFATTLSPWIVSWEALAPFRCALQRPADAPAPLPYLNDPGDMSSGALDIQLEVLLAPTGQQRAQTLSQSNAKHLVWTPAQLLTHHASNGCNLRPGDLLASGTVSGATKDSQGSLIELTERGSQPITLPTGEVRRFLENGDEVILRGYCEREGFRRIGFGECRGVIVG